MILSMDTFFQKIENTKADKLYYMQTLLTTSGRFRRRSYESYS